MIAVSPPSRRRIHDEFGTIAKEMYSGYCGVFEKDSYRRCHDHFRSHRLGRPRNRGPQQGNMFLTSPTQRRSP